MIYGIICLQKKNVDLWICLPAWCYVVNSLSVDSFKKNTIDKLLVIKTFIITTKQPLPELEIEVS